MSIRTNILILLPLDFGAVVQGKSSLGKMIFVLLPPKIIFVDHVTRVMREKHFVKCTRFDMGENPPHPSAAAFYRKTFCFEIGAFPLSYFYFCNFNLRNAVVNGNVTSEDTRRRGRNGGGL